MSETIKEETAEAAQAEPQGLTLEKIRRSNRGCQQGYFRDKTGLQ